MIAKRMMQRTIAVATQMARTNNFCQPLRSFRLTVRIKGSPFPLLKSMGSLRRRSTHQSADFFLIRFACLENSSDFAPAKDEDPVGKFEKDIDVLSDINH